MNQLHELKNGIAHFITNDAGENVPLPADSIGAPRLRADGDLMVSGQTVYPGERMPADTLHAVIVGSPFAKGHLISIDGTEALKQPGVIRVITAEDIGELPVPPAPLSAQTIQPITGDEIIYEGQPIAVVIAETLETAEAGAELVKLNIEAQAPVSFETAEAVVPVTKDNVYSVFGEIESDVGDFDAGLKEADAIVEQDYYAPGRHHNMLEPGVTLAEWRDGSLYIHDSTQWAYGVRFAMAAFFNVGLEKVNVYNRYIGGGFGAKSFVYNHPVIAAAAAKIMERPVRLFLTRPQTYTGYGKQTGVWSKITFGAKKDGTLTAMFHQSENVTSMCNDYIEVGAGSTRAMHQCPNIRTKVLVRRANVVTPTPMRAPHEGTGNPATEIAMDELAYKIGMDPLAFRQKNLAHIDPYTHKPFSSCKLDHCYIEGAKRFGWEGRPMAVRAMRDGNKLLGWGMGTAMMASYRFPARARCAALPDGRFEVYAATNEIGTAVGTTLAQVAAEVLKVPSDKITVHCGDTRYPETGGTFGSATTMCVGSAVFEAAEALQARVLQLGGDNTSPDTWPTLMKAQGLARIEADAEFDLPGRSWFDADGGEQNVYTIHTAGVVFVEMEVDEALGLARMRRAVGVYSAGRILNPVAARGQMVSGIIWGYGRAMLEASLMDPRTARYYHKNFSGNTVPVNADIPRHIDVSFIEEYDPIASAIGARGIGELCDTGIAPAIANAVFHATGKRVRELPIKIADLIA